MIKVEHINVTGFEPAIRGMRNPMNSWEKSDSRWVDFEDYDGDGISDGAGNAYVIGDNDLDLMRRLYTAGGEHRKYARMITVTMDITAPLYWWKEFDTYKVGSVANSCSTMHKISAKQFEVPDFSYEHLSETSLERLRETLQTMNEYRALFLASKDKEYWWQMIQLLPSSYNQKRTVQFSYENVFNMIKQRSGHKLDEWRGLVEILKGLPYVQEITEDN